MGDDIVKYEKEYKEAFFRAHRKEIDHIYDLMHDHGIIGRIIIYEVKWGSPEKKECNHGSRIKLQTTS